MEPVYSSVIGVARALFAFQGLRIRLRGLEHVPRTGGAVMVINHTGYFDFTYAGLAGVEAGRLVRFMAKKSIWDNPVARVLMNGMHHIPVDREAGQESFETALAALRAGEIVGVFPEATISRSFELKEFKSGAVRMAQQAGVPVLPVTIWGSQRIWTKGRKRRMGRHHVPLFITVGEAVAVGPDEDAVVATARVKDVMRAQLEADQRAYPAWPDAERDLLPVRLGGSAPSLEQADAMDAADQRARRSAG